MGTAGSQSSISFCMRANLASGAGLAGEATLQENCGIISCHIVFYRINHVVFYHIMLYDVLSSSTISHFNVS